MVSLIGYALVGAGLAPVVLILYNAAARCRAPAVPRRRPGPSRSATAGFPDRPAADRRIAHALTLTAAMGVVVVAPACCRSFAPVPDGGPRIQALKSRPQAPQIGRS